MADLFYEDSPAVAAFIAAAVMLVLMVSGNIVNIMSALLGCLFRWKENVNLYNNMKMRQSRNRILLALLPTAGIILSCYPLHPLTTNRSIFESFTGALAVIGGYFLARLVSRALFIRGKNGTPVIDSAVHTAYSFAVIGMILITLEFGCCRLLCVEDATVTDILKWTIIALYAIMLLRELQVFMSHRGFFQSFLYLCALEILPAALLAVSYFVF